MTDNNPKQDWVYALECLHALIVKVFPPGIPTRTLVTERLRELRNGVASAGSQNDHWPLRLEGEKLLAMAQPPPREVARAWTKGVAEA